MVRPCSPRPGVNCERGERRIGALLCHVAQICQLPPWASISARIHFTSSAWISVARSSCASDGRAARSELGWRTCHLVWGFAGADFHSLDVHVMTVPTLRLDHLEHQQALHATVAGLKPKLLVLDPLVRLHAIAENIAAEVAPLLG